MVMSYRRIPLTSRLLCLAPALCFVSLIAVCSLRAAEKNREWQTGQVVEPKGGSNARVRAIAGADKIYFVRGTLGDAEDELAVGATARFAVQGSNMFLSIGGKEYRLSILGTALKPASANTAVAVAPNTPEPLLDNDAIVQMAIGGLKEETIVKVIETRPGNYVLTPESMAALKAAGVPQGAIAAMTAKMKR